MTSRRARRPAALSAGGSPAAEASPAEALPAEAPPAGRATAPPALPTAPVAAGRAVDDAAAADPRLAAALEDLRAAELRAERAAAVADALEATVQARRRELAELHERRTREQRLATVGQLAAGAMHDVNNALNPIMAAAFLLHRHADDPASVRGYADHITMAAEAAAAAAARVGRFLRPEDPYAGRPDAVNLAALADEVVAMTRPLWATRTDGADIRLERRVDDSAVARGVVGELRTALLNLVHNALDAMRGSAAGTLGVAAGVDGGAAWIEVADTGTGMSDAVRARVCEPFFSTKGALGTGLGMSEVEGVMRRHGGRIDIESAPGAGTRVRLVLPSFQAVAAGRLVDVTMPRRVRRVLLVGPHGEGTEMMRTLLAGEGHDVAHAATAAAATGLLCAGSPDVPADMPYDVLVIDLGLDGGDGWELIGAARTRWPALRIGVVSGWEVQSRMGTSQTVDFMLRKPLRASDLVAYVGSGV